MTGTSEDGIVRCPGIQAHTSPSSQIWTGRRNITDFTFLVRLVTWQRGKDFVEIVGLPCVAQMVKNLPAMQETWVWSLVQEDPLEKGMATHCSMLAWRIPWTEEPGRLQSMGLQRVRHYWAHIHTHTFFFILFPIMVYHRILHIVPCVTQ